MRWTLCIEGGPRRVNHAAVAIKDWIYSFGGYCSGENSETVKPMDVYVFDTCTYRWRCLPLPSSTHEQFYITPYQRYGHTAIAYKDMCYIWGGRNDINGACSVLYQFDPRSGLWRQVGTKGDTAPSRDGHGACVYHDQMVIFGGFEEGFQRFSNDTYALDFRNNCWRQLHPQNVPPQWRDFHSTTIIGDRMYVFGGRSDESGPYHTNSEFYDPELMYLDFKENCWHKVATKGDAPRGRRSHSCWSQHGMLYMFGGYNGSLNEHYNDLYGFDPVNSSWTKLEVHGNAPKPRRRQCCVPVGDRVFMFGGTSPLSADFSELPMMDPMWSERNLTDHSDLYVLEFHPTLRTLCMMSVWSNPLLSSEIYRLPPTVRLDIQLLSKESKSNVVVRKDG
uniref:Kelch domain-containing protein 3 n=1 Tax=Trichuris muris TaxID=70415 RepID=A0A5S6QUW7_TRIMR